MKLYDYGAAPSPRRVRIFLAEKGLEVERVEVDLRTGQHLKPEFRAVNPRGVVPVLQLDDGTCIDESVAICRYFEEIQPEPPLMGTDAKSKALVDSWVRHADFDGFIAVAEAFRNSTPAFAKAGLPGADEPVPAIEALVDRGHASITRYFDRLNRRLGESPYLAGDRYTIADISAQCVVDFAKWVKRTVPDTHADLLRWHAEVSARPSAKA